VGEFLPSERLYRRATMFATFGDKISKLVQDAAIEVDTAVVVQPGRGADRVVRRDDVTIVIGLPAVTAGESL
jgi:hypothetical protein